MITSVDLFNYGMVAFFFAFLFYTIFLFSKKGGKIATLFAWLGVLIQGAGFALRAYEKAQVNMVSDWFAFYKYAPFTNMYESLMLFGWTAVILYLVWERKYQNRSFGMFVVLLALLGELSTQILGFNPNAQPLVPALQSNWLLFHVVTTFIGYSAFAVGAGIAYAYFAKRDDMGKKDWIVVFLTTWFIFFFVIYSAFRKDALFYLVISGVLGVLVCAFIYALRKFKVVEIFPSLGTMENVMYQVVAVGFVFLTVGIILGAVWAKYAWGSYWSWDPKETWSLITWLVYATYLHARFVKGLSGKPLAYFTVIGFLSVIFTYYGVNLIIPGLHSYAQ